jgi:hypothetical protein
MDINQLIEKAKLDPTLVSNLNIEKLLENVDNKNAPYLQTKNIDQINKEIFQILERNIDKKIPNRPEIIYQLCNKLVGYRYVDEIYQLHRGKPVRWLRLDLETPLYELSRGAIVVDNKFSDNGIVVLCKLFGYGKNQYTQYLFDHCLTFQKLTEEELFMLTLNKHIST